MLGSKTSMASVTIEEKRLRQLKQQLFGKEQPLGKEAPAHKIQSAPDSPAVKQVHAQTVSIDSTLLKKDFTKIISFSILALAIQLALFFANRHGLISLFN